MATTIKIGHASIGEQGSMNGVAGDQYGTEVFINEQYNITSLTPNVVLRPNTKELADKSVAACIAGCENSHIGYSQSGRNTLYNYASAVDFDLTRVTTDCNTDCSAFMTVCALAGGARITYGSNAPTTSNMRTKFKQSGDYTILTDAKHLTMTDYLRKGDILVKEGSHTVMVLENGVKSEDAADTVEGTTLIENIRINKLNISVTNVTDTSLTVNFTVSESINNKESIISNTSKWKFELALESLYDAKTITKTFDSSTLAVTGLTAGRSYKLQVSALEKKAVAFQSPVLIVSTSKDNKITRVENLGENMNIGAPFNLVNKIYIKDKNTFNQAIIYHNK